MFRTPRLKFIYVMWSVDFPWRAKIGISDNPVRRRNEVECSIRSVLQRDVAVHLFFKIPLLHARMVEGGLHHSLQRLECYSMTGSGYTEWYWYMNCFTALLAWLFLYGVGFERHTIHCLFLLIAPVPLDFVLFAGLLAAAQYAAVLAALIGAAYLIASIL